MFKNCPKADTDMMSTQHLSVMDCTILCLQFWKPHLKIPFSLTAFKLTLPDNTLNPLLAQPNHAYALFLNH